MKEWNANEKFVCIRCGNKDYTDYYCGGCHTKCCGEIIQEEMNILFGPREERI
jgi:hypothetical protein